MAGVGPKKVIDFSTKSLEIQAESRLREVRRVDLFTNVSCVALTPGGL
jgi:hypothetical protein